MQEKGYDILIFLLFGRWKVKKVNGFRIVCLKSLKERKGLAFLLGMRYNCKREIYQREEMLMKKSRKKIGVITSENYDAFQRKMIMGIQEEAYARDYDVLVFSSFVKGQMWNDYQTGEMNIYSMINYDKLDGVIIVQEQLAECKKVLEELEKLRERYPQKVVRIDNQAEELPCVLEDTTKNIQCIMEHLYEIHGVRDFAFLTGREGHPHSRARLQAYYDFMERKNLPVKKNRVFYGDFWYDSGEKVMQTLLESREGLPQAVCCASDTMGLSVYEACRKHNIKVPEEIRITGFDADGGGIVKRHFLTSTPRDAHNIGKNAARKLINQLEGENLSEQAVEEKLIIGQTCGCEKQAEKEENISDVEDLRQGLYHDFYSEYNFMMEDGIGAQGIEDCLWKIDWYTLHLKDKAGYYICLCDDWTKGGDKGDSTRTLGYSDRMNLIYSRYYDEKRVDTERFYRIEEMFPGLWEERESPCTFYFTALHFMRRCFGYGVLQYEKEPNIFPAFYWSWCRNVCNLLEIMRRYINMEKVNERLGAAYRLVEKNAVTDFLTGLYNRNGFSVYASEQLKLAEKEGSKLVVLMADLDDLKYINDNFGHAEGDFAIKQAGDAIKQFLRGEDSPYEKGYRIGGDEYTAVCVGDLTEEEIKLRANRMKTYLEHINTICGKPYNITISVGISKEDPKGSNLDQVVLRADQRMYQEKERNKRRRKERENTRG